MITEGKAEEFLSACIRTQMMGDKGPIANRIKAAAKRHPLIVEEIRKFKFYGASVTDALLNIIEGLLNDIDELKIKNYMRPKDV